MIKILITLALVCSLTQSYFVPPTQFGDTIRDLYENYQGDLMALASEWTVEGLVSENTKVGSCYGNLVLGGPGVVGLHGSFSRTYTKLTSHNFFYLDIGVKLIGHWKNNTDTFTLFFDGNPISTFVINQVGASDDSYSCTNTGKDVDTRLVASIAHSASSVTISLAWDIESENPKGSFAINDFLVLFLKSKRKKKSKNLNFGDININLFCPLGVNLVSPTTKSAALHLIDTSLTVISDYGNIAKTGCKPGYYLSGNSCLKCNEACQDCYGSENNLGHCYQCAWGYNSVDGRCLECPTNCAVCSENHFGLCKLCNPGYTLDFDGTCVADDTCNSSPSIIKNNEDLDYSTFAKVCSKTCPSSHFMLWNYTCTRECDLQQRWYAGFNWCDHPCTKNQYLLENGYCAEECPEGFTPRMEGFYGFCDLPDNSTGPVGCEESWLYKYENGSCLAECFDPYNLEFHNERSFCMLPCPGKYLTIGEACIQNCDSEWVRFDDNVLYCDDPAFANSTHKCDTIFEFKYPNGSCLTSCPAPWVDSWQQRTYVCNPPCAEGYYNTETEECVNTCAPENIYKQDGIYYCDPDRALHLRVGCSDPSLYKFQNGSCLGDCFWPYFEEYFNQRSFCTKPCPKGYWNESNQLCVDYCDDEYIRENDNILFCDGGNTNSSGPGCDPSYLYKYENGSCIESCPFPFTEEIRDQQYFCVQPCPSGYFDTLRSACVSTCEPEYIVHYDTILFCERPDPHPPGCEESWLYKYENGSCLSDCPYPYDQEFYRSKSFCNKPCGEENYFTKGEACIEACEQEYIRFENNVLFCDDPAFENSTHKCEYSWEYRFYNGSCLSYCPYPYITEFYQKQFECNLPCASNQFFDTANEVCLETCDAAYVRVIGDISFCDQFNNNSNSCPDYSDYRYHNGSCLSHCEAPYRVMWDQGYLCVPNCGGNYFNTIVERCMTYCQPEYAYSEGEIVYCDEPPKTNSNGCGFSYEYKYPNGSCLMTCPYPYHSEYRKKSEFCVPPCEGNYFVESSGICVDNCEEGYSRLEDCILYCTRPLESNCTITYNADGTKTTDCSVSNGVCAPGNFLFEDWSCAEVCPPEFTAYLNASCNFPCGQEKALYPDGTCGSFCRNGYQKRWEGSFRFCDEEENDETFVIKIGIYIRYEISLKDFNSYNYLAKFITKMAKLLGVRNSDIRIKSIKSGSTIIDSEVILKSGSDSKSVEGAKSKAKAMNNNLKSAAESNTLTLEGVKALNHRFSVTSEGGSKVKASSSSTAAIGVGIGVAAALLTGATIAFTLYKLKKRKNLALKVAEENYKMKGNTELVNIGDKAKDEEVCLTHSSIIDGTPITRPESSNGSPSKVGRVGFDPASPTSCQGKVAEQVVDL